VGRTRDGSRRSTGVTLVIAELLREQCSPLKAHRSASVHDVATSGPDRVIDDTAAGDGRASAGWPIRRPGEHSGSMRWFEDQRLVPDCRQARGQSHGRRAGARGGRGGGCWRRSFRAIACVSATYIAPGLDLTEPRPSPRR
jgi:hypothetical protein